MLRPRKVLVSVAAIAGLTLCTGFLVSRLLTIEPIGPPVAPDPIDHPEAVVQVYAADVWGFRGHFAVHTWIATKGRGERNYTVYQVTGWGLRRHGTAVSIEQGRPNRYWFNSPPLLLHDLRGPQVQEVVDKVAEAVRVYPFANEYVMWPGPNSNSFIQWVASTVPELGLSLPSKAIGKSWMEAYLAE